MDSIIRLMAYLIVGAVLLYCDVLYIRALRQTLEPDEYVIMPIKLVGQEDKDGTRGIALAQMLQARMKSIERDLADAQQLLSAPQSAKPKTPRSPAGSDVISFIPLMSAETVRMPTSLLEPANVNVSVGSVQVGGVVPWIQNLLVRKRTLTFTFYAVDANKTIVSGDATPLSGSDNGAVYFESSGSQDKAISDLSFALLMKHLTNAGGNKIDGLLSATDFQVFADGLVKAAALKRKISNGTPATTEEFETIFQEILPIAHNISAWPELKYFAASLAESAGESEQAVSFYKAFKDAALLPDASSKVAALARDARLDEKIASLSARPARPPNPDQPFDAPVTLEGSAAHCSVYYEPSLAKNGSTIARAVMARFDNDFARLTEIFGGAPPNSFNIVIKKLDPTGQGNGGAYHHGCNDETVYCDAKTNPALDPDFTGALAVSQATDVFGAYQNKGWSDCGNSKGTGLKRALAAALYPGKLDTYQTASSWLDDPNRPDYVSRNDPTDQDAVSTGCAVLFLNYMHTQLKIPWEKIVQAGGATLGETYSNLGLGNDGFSRFRQLMDKHYPRGKPSRLNSDNPFPLQ